VVLVLLLLVVEGSCRPALLVPLLVPLLLPLLLLPCLWKPCLQGSRSHCT